MFLKLRIIVFVPDKINFRSKLRDGFKVRPNIL